MVKSTKPRTTKTPAKDTTDPKPVKSKKVKAQPQPERVHFDVFSKSRGYLCSAPNEDAAYKALNDLFRENERFWRRARSEGKKSRHFDCYALARQGTQSRLIELTFDAERDESERDTYEDVIEKEQA